VTVSRVVGVARRKPPLATAIRSPAFSTSNFQTACTSLFWPYARLQTARQRLKDPFHGNFSDVCAEIGRSIGRPARTRDSRGSLNEHARSAGQIFDLPANRATSAAEDDARPRRLLVDEIAWIAKPPAGTCALRPVIPIWHLLQAIALFYSRRAMRRGFIRRRSSRKGRIGDGAACPGPYCYVEEDVEIGRKCRSHSFVTIYRVAKIGMCLFARARRGAVDFAPSADPGPYAERRVIGGDGLVSAKQIDGHGIRMLQARPRMLKDVSRWPVKSCVERATIEPASDRRQNRRPRPSSATAHALSPTPCFAPMCSPDQRRFGSDCIPGRARSARQDTSPSVTAPGSRRRGGIPQWKKRKRKTTARGNTHYSRHACVDTGNWLKKRRG